MAANKRMTLHAEVVLMKIDGARLIFLIKVLLQRWSMATLVLSL